MFHSMMFFINFQKRILQMKKFIVFVSAAMMSAAVMASPAEKAAAKVEDKAATSKTAKAAKTKTGTAATPLEASGVKAASGVMK